jgi:hypothetical protein
MTCHSAGQPVGCGAYDESLPLDSEKGTVVVMTELGPVLPGPSEVHPDEKRAVNVKKYWELSIESSLTIGSFWW